MQPTYYFDHARPEMLQFIPAGVKRVLDVGCGAGAFAAEVKRATGAEIWGIEISAEAAARARPVFAKLLVGDATQLAGALPDGAFDCIICNDVLEHLVDPFGLLATLRGKLAPGGRIVASVPNVRYVKNLVHLLAGRDWHYQDEGVLDRTHLRFFTRRSMLRSLAENRWAVERTQGMYPTKMRALFTLLNFVTFGHMADTKFMNFVYVFAPTA